MFVSKADLIDIVAVDNVVESIDNYVNQVVNISSYQAAHQVFDAMCK